MAFPRDGRTAGRTGDARSAARATVPLHFLTAASGTVPPAVHSAVLHPLQYVDPARQRLLLRQLNAMTYARNTTVSAIRTRNEIEETLESTALMLSPMPPRAIWPPSSSPWRTAAFASSWNCPIPRTSGTPTTIRPGSPAGSPRPGLPSEMAGALLLVIKAQLEAVTAGISTIETEFLANTTAGEWMLPQIDRSLSHRRDAPSTARCRAHRPPALRAHPAAPA